MVSSLLLVGPQIPEPLPLYTRDPETSSIRSAAPSYTSAAPSYHSRRPSHHCPRPQPARRSTVGLPPSHYAPGFRAHATGPTSNLENHRFEVSEWSPFTTGHHARQYQNVALRRATMANASEEVNALAAAFLGLPNNSSSSALPPVSESPLRPGTPLQDDISDNDPYRFLGDDSNNNNNGGMFRGAAFSPQEDPHLVGPEAAARARATRLYMRRCGDDEALRQERKTWDFLLGQMGDWRERERGGDQFRREVGRSRVLGRRIGVGR